MYVSIFCLTTMRISLLQHHASNVRYNLVGIIIWASLSCCDSMQNGVHFLTAKARQFTLFQLSCPELSFISVLLLVNVESSELISAHCIHFAYGYLFLSSCSYLQFYFKISTVIYIICVGAIYPLNCWILQQIELNCCYFSY